VAARLDICREELLSIARSIVAESGSLDGFDAAAWLDRWLNEPLPALGTTPNEHILAGRDCEVIAGLLRRMQSGSFS
jgi:hypothetical protein